MQLSYVVVNLMVVPMLQKLISSNIFMGLFEKLLHALSLSFYFRFTPNFGGMIAYFRRRWDLASTFKEANNLNSWFLCFLTTEHRLSTSNPDFSFSFELAPFSRWIHGDAGKEKSKKKLETKSSWASNQGKRLGSDWTFQPIGDLSFSLSKL